MLGVMFTNVFFAYRYFKDSKADFMDVMRELAIVYMHNDKLADERAESDYSNGSSRVGSTSKASVRTCLRCQSKPSASFQKCAFSLTSSSNSTIAS